MPQVEVIIGDQHHTFDVGEGDNLLFEAVARSIMIPFHCTSGRCGTCRVRVLKGGEELSDMGDREEYRLGEEQVVAGYRLACQLFVYGDVKVEVPQPRLY